MKIMRQSMAVILGITCILAGSAITPTRVEAADAPTITFLQTIDKTYDGTSVDDPSVSTNSDGTLSYAYYEGSSASGTPMSTKPKDAGTYTVVASTAASDHYAASSASKTFTIAQRKVTLGMFTSKTGDDVTVTAIVENALEAAGTIQFSADAVGTFGTVNVIPNGEFYQASATFSTNSSTSVKITATYSGSKNYKASTAERAIYKDKLMRDVNFTDSNNKVISNEFVVNAVYGGSSRNCNALASTAAGQDVWSYSIVSDDYHEADESNINTVTVDAEGTIGVVNAGTAYIEVCLEDNSGNTFGNTFNSAYGYVKVIVSPAPLTVTVSAALNGKTESTCTYGDLDGISYDLSYNDKDFKTIGEGKDTVYNFMSGRGSLQAASLPATAGVGTYSIGIQKKDDISNKKPFLSRNYAITCVPASFTVTPRNLTVTSSNVTSVWGTEPSSYAAPTVTGLASFDTADNVCTAATVYSGKSYSSLDPGTYPGVLTPSVSFKSTSMSANYKVVPVKGTLTIAKAATTLTIDDASKVYDGKPVSLKLNYDSRVEVTPIITFLDIKSNQTVSGIPTEPGTYQASAQITNSKYFNYVTAEARTFTISKIDPVYTVDDLSKTYDGKEVVPAVTSNTDASVTYRIVYTNVDTKEVLQNAPVNAGNYSITVISQETAHYNAAEMTKLFTIQQKESTPVVPTLPNVKNEAGSTLSEVTLPKGWTWDDPKTALTDGTMRANATYTPEDVKDYTRVTTPLTFTVEAASATSADNNENAGSVDTSTGSEIGEEAWILLAACLTGIGALVLKKRYQA